MISLWNTFLVKRSRTANKESIKKLFWITKARVSISFKAHCVETKFKLSTYSSTTTKTEHDWSKHWYGSQPI
ncbi:hypothetical protein D0962_17975 [Leptolyngbyaceae cyanobacterium CCMR0082]|uniref:Uncharacterized protein n=1 Tax=Adonisia turfae CCMR0082 TaxID=2304604 RepID=A0A6M0S992_9CYAN|nr:hypothetical protein [Adonisia turfae CCMR0082]